MALFSVERYMEEDDDFIEGEKTFSKASDILDRIKSEAKVRKKKRSQTSAPSPDRKIKFDIKRKHSELEQISSCFAGSESEDITKQEFLKTKKKRLAKMSEKVTESLGELVVNDSLTSSVIKPKKKKVNVKPSADNNSDRIDVHNKTKSSTDEETGITDKISKLKDNNVMKDVPERESLDKKEVGFTVLGNYSKKAAQKVERILPDWLSNPNIITADVRATVQPVEDMVSCGLHTDLVEKLKENGITKFFPVQIQVIPEMLDSLQSGFYFGKAGYRPNDICVSAPTGSGKTLAFVLPIIQALKLTIIRQVRALVVLPVRDLALQVFKVFQMYSKGTHIQVGLLVGQKIFSTEQQSLVRRGLRGFHSLVDIIVATPGRLVDHINQTEGFNLTFLRFLVIDEADKMMEQIKQDWLIQVENAVYGHSHHRPHPPALTARSCSKPQIPLQKLLFSATLSQNPEKLQQMNLFQPKLFTSVVKSNSTALLMPGDVSQDDSKSANQNQVKPDANVKPDDNTKQECKGEFVGKYTTPQGLTEFYVECKASVKPLMVLHLLHNLKFSNVLCFTNSVQATHRLYHLLRLVGGKEVREFSSNLHGSMRTRILQQFAANKIDIIICSDAMSRGMDIEGVKYVISYDPPQVIQTYIHRVGRTARAGRVGIAVTLLQKKECFHFKKMTREAGKSDIKELKILKESLRPIIPAFQDALKELPQILKDEKLKKLAG